MDRLGRTLPPGRFRNGNNCSKSCQAASVAFLLPGFISQLPKAQLSKALRCFLNGCQAYVSPFGLIVTVLWSEYD